MYRKLDLEWLIQHLVNEIKDGEKKEHGVWIKAFLTNTFLETLEDIIRDNNLEIER